MNLDEDRLEEAVRVLRSFGARRVLLFGSYLKSPLFAADVDLAVEGVPVAKLWRADGAVADVLGVPFDLVSRELNPEFFELIEKRARVLYEL